MLPDRAMFQWSDRLRLQGIDELEGNIRSKVRIRRRVVSEIERIVANSIVDLRSAQNLGNGSLCDRLKRNRRPFRRKPARCPVST